MDNEEEKVVIENFRESFTQLKLKTREEDIMCIMEMTWKIFDEKKYTAWKHRMKGSLISLISSNRA